MILDAAKKTESARGRVIFAESTAGKTTAMQTMKGLIDSDLLWKFWIRAKNLEGWKAVKDPAIMAEFRSESLPVFISLVDQGLTFLTWDAELAEQVANETRSQVTAYLIRDADEYVVRTLKRFEDGTKPRPPEKEQYAPETLISNHKRTEDLVRSKFEKIVEIPPDKYLADYLRVPELPLITGLSPSRW